MILHFILIGATGRAEILETLLSPVQQALAPFGQESPGRPVCTSGSANEKGYTYY